MPWHTVLAVVLRAGRILGPVVLGALATLGLVDPEVATAVQDVLFGSSSSNPDLRLLRPPS